jgi:hypothetical protein
MFFLAGKFIALFTRGELSRSPEEMVSESRLGVELRMSRLLAISAKTCGMLDVLLTCNDGPAD